MPKNWILSFSLLCLMATGIYAQESWSLEKCIDHAQKNNLTVKQSQIAIQQQVLNLKQNRLSQYPNMNGSAGYSYNFGRSIDPTTNQFVANTINANNLSVNSSATLYAGGRIKNSIKQSEVNRQAAVMDLEQTKQDIALSVAQAYLQVLLNLEQLNNAQVTVRQTQDQLNRINRLIEAGSLPEVDRYDIEAQLARDEQNLTAAQNNVDLSYLNLKQLLLLDPSTPFKILQPEITVPDPAALSIQPFQAMVQKAYETQPVIRANELRKESATYDIEIAKGQKLPTVSVFGNLGTNYSSLGRTLGDIQMITVPLTTITIPSTGEMVPVEVVQEVPTFETNPYFNQLNENLNGSVALSVSVPIYDRGVANIQRELAELGLMNADLALEQQKQNIKTNIQRAIADAKAAAKQMQAAERTVNASQRAFDNMKKRFDVGSANTLEYTTTQNNLEGAKFNLLIAKYDYIFKLKILDFYQGKPLNLN